MVSYNSTNKELPSWVCLLIGLVFISISVFLIKNDIDTKNSMDSQTQSYMVTHKKERKSKGAGHLYRPIYHYKVHGKSLSCHSSFSSSFISNKNKTIYYKSNEPQSCFVDEGFSGMFLYGLFFLFGLIPIFLYFKKNTSSNNYLR